MRLIEKMQKSENFTPTEMKISEFFLENKNALSEMTVYKLAKATYSSNAAIIRFCRKLGYKGFRDFRVDFEKELELNKFIESSSIDYTHPFQQKDSTEVIVKQLYTLYKKSLDQVQSCLEGHELEKIAYTMIRAKRIFLYGYGDVKLALMGFANLLAKINIFPVIATENTEERQISKYASSQDCALFVTYSLQNERFKQCAQILRERKAPIMLITANRDNLITKYSMARIFVPDMERPDRIATFYSKYVFEYILNLIYALIYQYQAENEPKVQK